MPVILLPSACSDWRGLKGLSQEAAPSRLVRSPDPGSGQGSAGSDHRQWHDGPWRAAAGSLGQELQKASQGADGAAKNAWMEVFHVYYWESIYSPLHHKFAVIDDCTVITGSYNW